MSTDDPHGIYEEPRTAGPFSNLQEAAIQKLLIEQYSIMSDEQISFLKLVSDCSDQLAIINDVLAVAVLGGVSPEGIARLTKRLKRTAQYSTHLTGQVGSLKIPDKGFQKDPSSLSDS